MRLENAAKIIFVIPLIVPSTAYLPCKEWAHAELRENCGGCGFCLSHNYVDSDYYRCAWNVQDYFYAQEQCKVVNKCDNNVNRAKCKAFKCSPLFGTFKCECDRSTFGQFCEFSKPQGVPDAHYAVVADIALTPMFFMGEFGTLSIFFKNIGENVLVQVFSSYEHLIYTSKGCDKVVFTEYCNKWFRSLPQLCKNNPNLQGKVQCVITVNFMFPTADTAAESEVLDYNYEPDFKPKRDIGVKEFFTITVYNDLKTASNFPLFDTKYNMINLLQSPHLHYCEPYISVRNVATRMTSYYIVTYAIRDEIIILSSAKYPDPVKKPHCVGTGNYMYQWRVWKFTYNLNVLTQKPFLEVFKDSQIYFKPFSLKKGIYKIIVNLTSWTKDQQSFDFNFGYFEVVELDLEAIISGGEQREIYYKENSLKLDGSQSWDPNLHPSKQLGKLKFYWSCNRTELAFCGEKRSDYNVVYPGPFLLNEYYKFYLTVKSVANESNQDTTSQIVFMAPISRFAVELICRKNCGWGRFQSNPRVVIYFEAIVHGVPSNSLSYYNNFNWSYSPGSDGNYLPVENIRQNNTPNSVLIVLKNTLLPDEKYTFRAEGVHERVGEATFQVKMARAVSNVTCKLDAQFKNVTIIRGVTKFSVECDNLKYNKFAPIYDLYDVRPGENVTGTGRLVASTRSKVESNIVVSRGHLLIELTDEYGMTSLSIVDVKLEPMKNTRDFIFYLLNELRQEHVSKTTEGTILINQITLIYDLIVNEENSFTDITDIIELMLRVCADIAIYDIHVLKIVSGFLNAIASGEFKNSLSMNSINYLSKSVSNLSRKLLIDVTNKVNLTDISELTITGTYKLCQQLLKICDSIYESSAVDLTKKIINKEDRQDYYASYRDSSGSMVRSIRTIMSCLSLITLAYEWPTVYKEDYIKVWLKEDTPEAFSETGYEPIPSVEVPQLFARSAGKVSKFVVVHVAQFNNSPYSYNTEFNIYTDAVDVRIMFKPKSNVLRTVGVFNPVVINLRHSETKVTVVNGSVQQPDPYKSLRSPDSWVAVHQLREPQMGTLVLKFLNLQDGQEIRVRVLLNKRPDYEFMIDSKNVYKITKSSPYVIRDLQDPYSQDLYDLYYIGILPGSNHQVGSFINYTFEMSTFHCVNWKFHEWSTSDCKVNQATEPDKIKCECKVFSTFAGFSQIPSNKFDPFDSYKLFLTQTDNLFVQILLGLIFLAFVLLMILAIWKDYRNVKGKVIYLEDNFPGDKFSYLIAVFTGSKFFGGTTSNVGIIIEGEKSCSRPHMLRSSWCHTLRKGEDDWFLLSTMTHLGNLKMVHLWMDYSGKRPEWYCYKIIVIDMISHEQYLFLVDAWLSLRGKNFIERFVTVTKNENDKRLYIAVDNLIFGLRDTHLWLAVCFEHPRSVVSRAQRVATAFNELLIVMLVSCLFFTVLDQRDEDYPYYHLSSNVLLIIMVSVLIASSFVNILLSVFRKTFLFKVYGKKEKSEKEEKNATSKKKHKSTNFLFRCCEDSLKVFTNLKKFKPVILQFDKRGIPRKEIKYSLCCLRIGWLIAVVMIIICFITIYFISTSMRKVKAIVWLTCVTLSLLLILFVIAPLKILVLSILSGLFYYNINQVVMYHIRMHLLDKYKRHIIDSNRHIVSELISMRRHSCYIPLTYKKMMKKIHKQRKFDATLLLLDMFLIGLLLVLLFLQNESLWTTKYYWNNNELRSLLKQGYKEEGVQLYSLTKLPQYSIFLGKSVFPVIYQTRWYNRQPILDGNSSVRECFVFGGTSKLFGVPRLRQKRLKPLSDLCVKPIYENLSQYCNVKLTEDTQDTNLYAEGWVETGPRESFHKLSPWNYLNESETYDNTFLGYSNTAYKGDGYVAELDMTEERAEDIVITLDQENWLDSRTVAVIFELTLYNAFSGTFSWLISVTENLHVGLLMNKVYVFTVGDDYEYPIIDLVFFLGLFMFSVRVFFVVNKNGIDDFADDFWNIFEMIMVCLGITCAILYFLNINSKFNYFKTYMIGDTREKFFEFLHLLQHLDAIRIILSVLIIMLVCRFMKSWKFGITFYMLFKTLSFSWKIMSILFLILFFASYLYWAFLSCMINDFMISKHNFPMMSKIDFKQIVKSCNTISCKISPFVLCFASVMVQSFIVLLFLISFRIVKRRNVEIPPMNFFTIFLERFKKYLYEIKPRRKRRKRAR